MPRPPLRPRRSVDALAWSPLPHVASRVAGGSGRRAKASDRCRPGAPWPRWQARISVATAAPGWRAADAAVEDAIGLQLQSTSLLGDCLFQLGPAPAERHGGGFRATSGVLCRHRACRGSAPPRRRGRAAFERRPAPARRSATPIAAADGRDTGTLPYIGVGYSSLACPERLGLQRRPRAWSRSHPDAVRLGRRVRRHRSTSTTCVRDMRLTPVVQLRRLLLLLNPLAGRCPLTVGPASTSLARRLGT